MKCPYCGSEDLFFDNIMRNYICDDCDRIIYDEEIEDESF